MSSEKALLEACKKGKRKAQYELYQHFSGQMLAVCMRYSKKKEDAEDILQEGFIKIFKNIKSFRAESSLYYWMKRIMVNTALNYHRSKLYAYPMVDVEEVYDLAEEEFTLSNYNFNDLMQMLNALPDGCRVIFNLYAIEGFQHKEIAEMLNVSIGTSKSQYSRAKSLLKNMIVKSEQLCYERYEEK